MKIFFIRMSVHIQSDMYTKQKRQTQKVKCMIQKTCIKFMYI